MIAAQRAPSPTLLAESGPRARPEHGRLLVVDTHARRWRDLTMAALPALLEPGDLLVVNDAATLPASLSATVDGRAIELRLVARAGEGRWWVVAFGEGDWREDTDTRPAPPAMPAGALIAVGGTLRAHVGAVSERSSRLVRLDFEARGAELWEALYAIGRPIQYSYLERPLALGAVQTAYAGRPWAVEMPSAGYGLRHGVLAALRARGVGVARLTHAAGLSATGDPALDALLPLPERYDIPQATVDAVMSTPGRVIAVGTSVVRALEGAARTHGRLVAGAGCTDLVLRRGASLSVVDGLLTGMHEAGESSHYDLLEAVAPPSLLAAASAHAASAGYRAHEFGDAALVLPGVLGAPQALRAKASVNRPSAAVSIGSNPAA